MKLHNSLTRSDDDFKPQNPETITIYSCGPTVYDRTHIGNLSYFIYADMLKRSLTLAFPETRVTHVMNLTDVDDKTITRSHEQYPDLEPKEALKKLTSHYEALFKSDLTAVGIDLDKITFTRATDYIDDMQKLINELVSAGIGYLTDDGVYFSIEKYKQAGKTYGQLVELTAENTGSARVNNDEYDKDNVHDFALWKKQKDGEPSWPFEINGQDVSGRPGWHIECSAMSVTQLGQPFDIHTGGVDLMFPHHENEIAQSTAASDQKLLAHVFVHNEHMLVDGQKMSKSLNNFFSLGDVTEKAFDPLAFRLLVLQSHYRNQAHFSWANLNAAQNRLRDLRAWADLTHQDEAVEEETNKLLVAIHTSLENDLNQPEALMHLSQLTASGSVPSHETLKKLDSIFALELAHRPDIDEHLKQLITDRETARKEENWQRSDELRAELTRAGLGLNDTPNGTRWFRLS